MHFLNKNSGQIEIDDLINSIRKTKMGSSEFVQKSALVALATVIAPHSPKYVPKSFFCLVEHHLQLKNFNWNAFTRRLLLQSITKLKEGGQTTQWPKGNLALLQVQCNFFVFNLIWHHNYLSNISYLYAVPILGKGASID